MSRGLFIRLGMLLSLCAWAVSMQAAELKIGQKAPDFELKTIFGDSTYSTKTLYKENELTVLIFWTTNCPDCWKALRSCRDLASKVTVRKVKVLGVNFDTERLATVRSMIKGEKIDFVNLSDFQGKVAAMFQTESYDFSSFIVDRRGILRHVGYDHPPDVNKMLLQKVNEILGSSHDDKSQEKAKDARSDKDRKV